MTDDRDIAIMVGSVEAGLRLLTQFVMDDRERAADSRAAIHRRLDDQTARMTDIEKAVTKLENLEERLVSVEADAKVIRQIKTIGGIVSFMLVSLGVSVAGVLLWASDFARTSVLHWLGLGK